MSSMEIIAFFVAHTEAISFVKSSYHAPAGSSLKVMSLGMCWKIKAEYCTVEEK